jgi:peptidoglycan/xylan/chitin deacetylase (PgdA/CDA1 family)
MKGKKRLLARAAGALGVFDHIMPFKKERLIVFNYHRIRPDTPNFSTPFDDDVFGPTVQQLRSQIEWLRKRAKILSESEGIEILESKRPPGEGCALITFDDGYRDNWARAYPILRELGAPAIFFIPTDLVEGRRLGWWDVIAYLIKETKKRWIEFEGRSLFLGERRLDAIRFFQRKMALDEHGKTRGLIQWLQGACDVALPGREEQAAELMTWEQIREMSGNGMSIGAHGHTHDTFSTLYGEGQEIEMTLPKAILEKKLCCEIKSIAYPVGGEEHFTEGTKRLAAKAGYRLGFSFCGGVNAWKETDRYNIKRIAAPVDLDVFKGTASLPSLFG